MYANYWSNVAETQTDSYINNLKIKQSLFTNQNINITAYQTWVNYIFVNLN